MGARMGKKSTLRARVHARIIRRSRHGYRARRTNVTRTCRIINYTCSFFLLNFVGQIVRCRPPLVACTQTKRRHVSYHKHGVRSSTTVSYIYQYFFSCTFFSGFFFSKTYRSRCRRAGSRGESRGRYGRSGFGFLRGRCCATVEYDGVDIFPGPRNPDVAAIVRSRRTLYLHVIRVC